MKEYALAVNGFRQRLNGSGRQLDLLKCTSIRFQAQDVDGTENEIIMEKMLFAGNPASRYSSPPPYIQPDPGLPVRWGRGRGKRDPSTGASEKLRMVKARESVRFELPSIVHGISLEIITVTGKSVKNVVVPAGNGIVWDFTDRHGQSVIPGCYIARLKVGTSTCSTAPVYFVR
jgi:hypothetical protein